jgi:hypothetical protein
LVAQSVDPLLRLVLLLHLPLVCLCRQLYGVTYRLLLVLCVGLCSWLVRLCLVARHLLIALRIALIVVL